MKIYTQKGDKGETSVIGGARVSKHSPRLSAYGDVDELNTVIGVAGSFCILQEIREIVQRIQNDLFIVGADLAAPLDVRVKGVERLEALSVKKLETYIDRLEAELEPLQNFILPGGSKCAALFHQSRAICRRAERNVVALLQIEDGNPIVTAYLNRLSDLLFVIARYVNKREGIKDIIWKREMGEDG